MRTTLDVDDRVLAVVKSRASAHKTTAGFELSKLALLALDQERGNYSDTDRFTLAPVVPGFTITTEMVADLLDD